VKDVCKQRCQGKGSYTSKFKLEVVKFAKEHGGNRAAGREFGITQQVAKTFT
jgi:transposase-like protein